MTLLPAKYPENRELQLAVPLLLQGVLENGAELCLSHHPGLDEAGHLQDASSPLVVEGELPLVHYPSAFVLPDDAQVSVNLELNGTLSRARLAHAELVEHLVEVPAQREILDEPLPRAQVHLPLEILGADPVHKFVAEHLPYQVSVHQVALYAVLSLAFAEHVLLPDPPPLDDLPLEFSQVFPLPRELQGHKQQPESEEVALIGVDRLQGLCLVLQTAVELRAREPQIQVLLRLQLVLVQVPVAHSDPGEQHLRHAEEIPLVTEAIGAPVPVRDLVPVQEAQGTYSLENYILHLELIEIFQLQVEETLLVVVLEVNF